MIPQEIKQANRMKTHMMLSLMEDIEYKEQVTLYDSQFGPNRMVDYILCWRKDNPNLLISINAEFCCVNRVVYYEEKHNTIHFFSHHARSFEDKIHSYEDFYNIMWNLANQCCDAAIKNEHAYLYYPTVLYYEYEIEHHVAVYDAVYASTQHSVNGDLLVGPIIQYILKNLMKEK